MNFFLNFVIKTYMKSCIITISNLKYNNKKINPSPTIYECKQVSIFRDFDKFHQSKWFRLPQRKNVSYLCTG